MPKRPRSVAIYFSTEQAPDRQPLLTAGGELVGYVRAVIHNGQTMSEALDVCSPRPGESVCNTHSITNFKP